MVNYLALISAIRWKKRTRRGRGRKRRKGSSLEIPLDLQMEILTRLPAKSLMRFKCVSKIWSCLIRSRYFTNRYHTVACASRRPPRLYMSLVEQLGCASMEVCHSPGKSELISFSSSSSDSGESFSPDLTMPGMGGCNMVVLRGLILYKVFQRACIYNLATRQSITLPAVKSNIFAQEDSRKYVFYFLGHDPVLDRYKVVCNVVLKSPRITSEHWVFVLEGGGSWKKTEFDQPHVPTRRGLCIDGVIYYLASTSISRCIVFSFDVRSEEFNMIQVPPSVSDFGEYVGFIEYGGKPTIFDHTHLVQTCLVDLWVVEDGGKWSKKKSLVLQPSQMHIFDGINHLAVQCTTTQNGEVMLAPSPMPSSGYFLYYDLQKNDLRKVHVSGICDCGFGETHIYFTIMDKSESIVHLET